MSIENYLNNVYEKYLNGALVTIGNTCTVVGSSNNKALEYLKPDGTYTFDWNEMGSSAYLDILEDSTIDFALLEWHSTVKNSFTNVRMNNDFNPIIFSTPKKAITITPTPNNEATFTDVDNNSIVSVKWIDVTSIVSQDYTGVYTVSKIPTAYLPGFNDHNQAPGWSLTVVYKNNNLPNRQIIINVGIRHQTYSFAPIGRNFNPAQNSKIPNNPIGKCYLTIVASGSSPNKYAGLSVYNKASNNLVSFKNIIGSNDNAYLPRPSSSCIPPFNNIFSGLIMNTNTESENFGLIETRGTLGNKNNDSFSMKFQTSFKGNRAKLDILCFDISDKIKDNDGSIDVSVDLWNPNNTDTFDITVSSLQIDLDNSTSTSTIDFKNSLEELYRDTLKGGIITISNTCTVVGSSNDTAREFIRMDGSYTNNWHEIGSTSLLNIPQDSTIVLAILEWHSTVKNELTELSDIEKTSPIILNTNKGDFKIEATNSKELNESYLGTSYKHLVRWSDITSIIKNTGNGIYAVIGIPTAIPLSSLGIINHNERVGWSLTVIYENASMALNSISLKIGINQQSQKINKMDRFIKLDDFKLFNNSKKSYLTLLVGNGNPNTQSLLLGYKDASSLSIEDSASHLDNINSKNPLPYHNIFSGIIKNVNPSSSSFGNIDFNGTLGFKNNTSFYNRENLNFTGNRSSLDLISFDISDKISSNQEELLLLIDQKNISHILDIYLISLQSEVNSI